MEPVQLNKSQIDNLSNANASTISLDCGDWKGYIKFIEEHGGVKVILTASSTKADASLNTMINALGSIDLPIEFDKNSAIYQMLTSDYSGGFSIGVFWVGNYDSSPYRKQYLVLEHINGRLRLELSGIECGNYDTGYGFCITGFIPDCKITSQ